MSTYLDHATNELKALFGNLATLVEDNVRLATDAVLTKNALLVETAKENDKEIDKKEIHIEEACIQFIAMHQPKAQDLRFVIAMLKANNDLERISDLAVSIAGSALHAADSTETDSFELPAMIEKVLSMLNKSIHALINLDSQLAITVCSLDDEVDRIKHSQRKHVKQALESGKTDVDYYLNVLINGRRLERIGDLCTNLAEDVIYITEGKIIRHKTWQDSYSN